VNLLSY